MSGVSPFTPASREAGTVIALYVQPRSSKTEVSGLHDGALRLRVAAPPVDGEANAEIIAFLGKRLGVAKASIHIVSGESGRRKRVLIDGLAPAEVELRLAV